MSEMLDLPYQREGAQWLATQRRAGLADEQGLGKTVQAIMACDMIGAQRIVVICPAKARATWTRSFDVFGRQYAYRKLRIMSYEEATRVFGNIANPRQVKQPDVTIIDEAHYLKDWQSQRTQAIYPKTIFTEYVWPMSGTPMPNDPSELWTHFYYLKPSLIPASMDGPQTPAEFLEMYCHLGRAYGGRRKVLGVKNEFKLRELNRALWLRRKKADVLPQLPPMRYGEIVVEANIEAEVNRIVADLPRDQYQRLLMDPSTLPFGDEHLMTLRKLIAVAKAPVLADFIEEELTNNPTEKIVLFAWHTEAIDVLAKRLKKFGAVVVDGRTAPAKVQGVVDAFQNQDACRVFVGQIKAAGTCLTLTAASNIVFLECSWVPSDNDQAKDRIHRIGQNADSCLCRTVTLKDSIDEVVTRVLARKSNMVNKIIT